MWAYISYGIILGLSAGVSPGPLLSLVITQTIQHNTREGIKVAAAPLLTDIPIICLVLLLLSNIPERDFTLGLLSFVGAAFIFALGINSIRQKAVNLELTGAAPRSYLKGVLVNALSPHPYIFWFSVGVPTIIRAERQLLAAAVAFVLCFYIFLVGSKMTIALLVGRSRRFLSGPVYLGILRIMGLCLIGFAALLLKDALSLTGLL